MLNLQSLNIVKKGDQFTKAHVLLTLQLISSELILGRYEIEKNLHLTNSAARILLNRLVEHDLIQAIKRRGHRLTEKGRSLLKVIHDLIPYNAPIALPTLVPEPSYIIQIRNAQGQSPNGIIERDLAVRHGARGGITILIQDKKFKMPGIIDSMETKYSDVVERLTSKLLIEKGNLLFITFADSLFDAVIAGIMVGLWIIECNKK